MLQAIVILVKLVKFINEPKNYNEIKVVTKDLIDTAALLGHMQTVNWFKDGVN